MRTSCNKVNNNLYVSIAILFLYSADCSRQLENPQGYVQSPGYPRAYPAGKDCVWQINAPSGFRIKVQFSEFHLREVDSSRGCLDFLEMREGNLPLSKFTGRYCGRNNPGEMVLPSNRLRLSFHSQEGHSDRPAGFRVRYQFIGRLNFVMLQMRV